MIAIAPMATEDIAEAIALWVDTEGMVMRDADSPDALRSFLQRNPGCSFVARSGGQLAGAALCGHDGRRGYLYHVAVDAAFRRQGVAKALVQRCLAVLGDHGILKCHIFVFQHNEVGKAFWEKLGFKERADLDIMSTTLSDSENG